MNFRNYKIFLVIVIAALVIGGAVYFYSRVRPGSEVGEELVGQMLVTKVLDGDTVIVEGGYSVRLLGIDADDRGYPCYQIAQERLEELVLNKEVRLEKDEPNKDQYQRYLRYIFLGEQNINLQLVEEGLAIARFSPENIKYKDEIREAEEEAKEGKIGCKWGGIPKELESPKEEEEISWQKLTPEATGLKVVGACNAGNYVGQEIIVEGKIVDTYKYQATNIFLNFGKAYPNQCFTGLIWADDWYKFPEAPEKYYLGKQARIKGKVIEYKGTPEIILKDPSQIEVGE